MPTRRATKPPSTFIESLLLAEQEKPPDEPGWVHANDGRRQCYS